MITLKKYNQCMITQFAIIQSMFPVQFTFFGQKLHLGLLYNG